MDAIILSEKLEKRRSESCPFFEPSFFIPS